MAESPNPVAGCDSASSIGSEQASGVRRRSGEQAFVVAALPDVLHSSGADANAALALEGLTVREALRRPIFWLILLSIFFIDVLWGGFNLHFVSVLEDQGLGRSSGASTFLATSIAAALSSLLCGPFFDRLPAGMKVTTNAFPWHSIKFSVFTLVFRDRCRSTEVSPWPLVAACSPWYNTAHSIHQVLRAPWSHVTYPLDMLQLVFDPNCRQVFTWSPHPTSRG